MVDIKEALLKIITDQKADIFTYNFPIARDHAYVFYDIVSQNKSKDHKTVILFLETGGGDADAAYLIGRCLQSLYEKVIVAVSRYCKSAGTIVALSAHELYMDRMAEFGPLDVQMLKEDEFSARSSGLDVMQGLITAQTAAFEAFENFFMQIVAKSGGRLTTKTAADIALDMASELYKPITAQIDPVRLGETQRAIDIAKAYGKRLASGSGNLKEGGLEQLIMGYPCHSYVIDFIEAKAIFRHVHRMNDSFSEVGKLLLYDEPMMYANSIVQDAKAIQEDQELNHEPSANENIGDPGRNDSTADAGNPNNLEVDQQESERKFG